MIRSTNIPIILNRICDDTNILSALLVTSDGELLGHSNRSSSASSTTLNRNHPPLPLLPTPESLGTLIADIALDYHRLGEEFSTLKNHTESPPHSSSKMECLYIEMELGIVGISSCNSSSSSSNNTGDVGCFVIVIAALDAPLGYIQMRLQTVTTHIQESLLSSTVLTTTNTSTNNNNSMTVT